MISVKMNKKWFKKVRQAISHGAVGSVLTSRCVCLLQLQKMQITLSAFSLNKEQQVPATMPSVGGSLATYLEDAP